MNDKSAKPSTFTKYAKGLLSRPAPNVSPDHRFVRNESSEQSNGKSKTQDLSYSAEGTISAMASSPDLQNVVIAGREVFKILLVNQHEVVETHNLRRGNKGVLNYTSNDVKWGIGPTSTLIATATSSGSIITWNVDYTSHQKIDRILNGHNRAVNRLAFNPGNGSWLLSASQDGSMKLWDLREPEGSARFILHGKAEAVRDVEFNSTNALELAAVYDNGTLQKWDLRNPKIYERKLNAHHGLALALNWHADGRHLVTGGRDKVIKIWDLGSEMRKPVNYIHAMAPVARVAWRPGDAVTNCQIASCSFSLENAISLWNLRRPNVASRVLDAHQAVATGILWKDKETLWSCSKDQTFRQHNVDSAPEPIRLISHYAIGWSNKGDLALCLGDRKADQKKFSNMERESQALAKGDADPGHDSRRHNKHRPAIDRELSVPLNPRLDLFVPKQSFSIVNYEDRELQLFRHLAERYDVTHDNPIRACARNALIAYEAHQQQASRSWKIIKCALEQADRSARSRNLSRKSSWNQSLNTSKLGESLIHRDLERLRSTPRLMDSTQSTLRANSPVTSFIMPRYLDQSNATASTPTSATPSRPRTADLITKTAPELHNNEGDIGQQFQKMQINSDNVILPDPADSRKRRSDSWASTYSIANSWDQQFIHESPGKSQSPDSTHHDSSGYASDIEMVDRPIAKIELARDDGPRRSSIQNTTKWKTLPCAKDMPQGLTKTIYTILEHFQDLGNVQMCSTICLVLTHRVQLAERQVDNWLYSYIELLQKQQMFTVAAEVIKVTTSEFIKSTVEGDTVMQTSCARCRKAVPFVRESGDYWMCSRCQNTVLCIFCGTVIKRSAVWCTVCNHTAHRACRAHIDREFDGQCVAPDCVCQCASV